MELHPFLDKDTCPNGKIWYVLSAIGECPSIRVGHTCSYIPGEDGSNGKVYVIGGANPSGPFAETFVLDLDTFSWDTCDAPGLKARYEHAAFVPRSQPSKIYIFGGADQGGNHNDIQVFDTKANTWNTLTPTGTPPSPRTYHVMTSIGDEFIVYSGGQCGSDPVGDRQVHCFDANTAAWKTLNIKGDSPKPRHGHLLVAVGNKMYLHGGMSGTAFYDDLHVLDFEKKAWNHIKQKRGQPCARAAHSGTAVGSDLYIFGGMNKNGALDDTYKLNTLTNQWSKVEYEGPPPACRLDFAMCAVTLKVPIPTELSPGAEELVVTGQQAKEVLDKEMRMNSAGSARSAGSMGSAGSQRSAASVNSLGSQIGEVNGEISPKTDSLPSSPQHITVLNEEGEGTDVAGAMGDLTLNGPTKTVEMCLVFGGMDTEGEIFDDCLVLKVCEGDESASA